MSRAAYSAVVEWTDEDTARQTYQDEAGRLWDVLWMGILAGRASKGEKRITYSLLSVPRAGRSKSSREVELVMHIGPGDAGESVITIRLPGED